MPKAVFPSPTTPDKNPAYTKTYSLSSDSQFDEG